MKSLLTRFIAMLLFISLTPAIAGQGKLWKPLPPLPYSGPLSNIAVDDNGVLYISTNSNVYRSTDNGATWNIFGEEVISGDISDIAVRKGQPNTIVITTGSGIFWSTNGGHQFQEQHFFVNNHTGQGGGAGATIINPKTGTIFPAPYIMNLSGAWREALENESLSSYLLLDDGSVLAMGGNYMQGKIYESTNDGLSWSVMKELPGRGQLFPGKDMTIYADIQSYSGTDFTSRFYIYTDSRSNWQEIIPGTQGLPGSHPDIEIISVDRQTGSIYAKVYNPKTTYSEGVYISSDGMKTWQLLDSQLEHVAVHEMTFMADGSLFFVTENNGVLLYDPRQELHVQGRNNGLTSFDNKTLAITGKGTFLTYDLRGVLISQDKGITWNSVVVGERYIGANTILETPHGTLFMGTIGSNSNGQPALYTSTDGGLNWEAMGEDLLTRQGYWTGVDHILTDMEGRIYVFTENSGDTTSPFSAYVSSNEGKEWKKIEGILPSSTVSPSGMMYTVGLTKEFNFLSLRSSNLGTTWDTLTLPSALSFNSFPQLFTDRSNALYFYAQGTGTYISRDNGTTWETLKPEPFSLYPDHQSNAYRVYDHARVYFLENGSSAETEISDGLPGGEGERIINIAIDGDNTPYASHSNGRIYELIGGTSDAPENGVILSQASAYPNPFVEKTTIAYELPQASPVTVRIFSVLGEQVDAMILPLQQAGSHRVTIQGDFAPGAYIYKITTGNQLWTGLLIRK